MIKFKKFIPIATLSITCFTLCSSFSAKDFSHFPFLCHDQRVDLIRHVETYKDEFTHELYQTYMSQGISDNEAFERAKSEVLAVIEGMRFLHDGITNKCLADDYVKADWLPKERVDDLCRHAWKHRHEISDKATIQYMRKGFNEKEARRRANDDLKVILDNLEERSNAGDEFMSKKDLAYYGQKRREEARCEVERIRAITSYTSDNNR